MASRLGGSLVLSLLSLALVVVSASDAAACSYCSVGLVCCGDLGETSCAGLGGDGCNFACKDGLSLQGGTCQPDCSYCNVAGICCGDQGQTSCAGLGGCGECKSGLELRLGTCQPPCSYCEAAGVCCGDQGQTSCGGLGGGGCNFACKDGLRLKVATGTCQPFECSYCQTVFDNCCGDIGQVSCAGTGQMASGDCNFSCQTGGCFHGSGTCQPCDSCDDGSFFSLGGCGKSYQRICGVPCPVCDDDYEFDIDQNRFIGTNLCQPTWRAPSGDVPQTGFDVTFFVVGDTHVGDIARGLCSPTSAYKVATTMVNTVGSSGLAWPSDQDAGQFIFSKHGQAIGDPRAVVLTGDMTHRGGDSGITSFSPERRAFQDYWDERRKKDDDTPSVDFTVYPGLGNHDRIVCGTHERDFFQSFVDFFSTQDWWDDNVNCPIREVTKNDIIKDYMRGRMKDRSGVNFDNDSLNYSWDWGPIHLVQGNTWAGDNDSLDWLRDDLAAHAVGKPVIIFQHYGWDSFSKGTSSADATVWWTDQNRSDFHNAIAPYNVVGIFTGHRHAPDHFLPSDTSGPGFEVYTTDDMGDDDPCGDRASKKDDFHCSSNADCDDLYDGTTDTCNGDGKCDYTDANNGVIKGDGGITVVRIADLGACQARFEVAQMQWVADYATAGQMTLLAKGDGSPTSSKVINYCAVCGNGIVESGEECDGRDCCTSGCRFAASGAGCTADTNGCTDDVCDGAGTCTHPNNSAPCDDSLFCDGLDTCSGGACTVHAGDPCIGRPVCENTCNEAADDCLTPAATACTDDHDACTTDECDGGGSCDHTHIDCDDHDPCTVDGCDPATGCTHPLLTEPTLFSANCRLAAMLVDIGSSPDVPASVRTVLANQIGYAKRAKERAEERLNAGKPRVAKARLQAAIRRLVAFQYRINSLTGRSVLPATASTRLLGLSGPLIVDLGVVRDGL